MCSNGKPAPVQRADWLKYARAPNSRAGRVKAAKTKNPDAIVEVAGMVSDACAACHDVYREEENRRAGPLSTVSQVRARRKGRTG
jgi:hypothetical protein